MAAPPSIISSPVVTLVIRFLTLILLFISVIVNGTNKEILASGTYYPDTSYPYTSYPDTSHPDTSQPGTSYKVYMNFNHFYSYRYMLASGVIGMAYTLLQIVFTIFHLVSGNRIGGDATILLDFFADKVLSYILATGAAAGFGVTMDMYRGFGVSIDNNGDYPKSIDHEIFLEKANAAASLLFIGFIFSAITSIFSSFSLSKRGQTSST